MGEGKNRPAFSVLAAVLVLLGACSPARPPESSSQTQGIAVSERPAAPRVLTLADQVEPAGIFFLPLPAGGGSQQVTYIFHDELWPEHAYEAYQPQLAAELPSFDKGTWRVNADGTTDTTWKLRPNVLWHDGAPFTSADLVFTYLVNKDPSSAQVVRAVRYIDSVDAPDPLTFVIHWREPYAPADHESMGRILPRHLLADLYTPGAGRTLQDSLYFSTEFVGLGPYRLVQWDRGSQIVATRFDQYYQGRPPLDGIIMRFIADPNTIVANVLAGTADVASWGIDIDAALEVKQRWEGSGGKVLFQNTDKIYVMEVQYRPDYARPRGAFANRDVRQAFLQSIDRPTMVETVTHGFAPIADSYFPPDHPLQPQLGAFVPQFPYDPGRAATLLDGAGWTRGPDGVRANVRTGDRLDVALWSHPDSTRQRLTTIIADDWKAVGVAPDVSVIPPARLNDVEYGYLRPAWWIVSPTGDNFYLINKLHSREIPTAENRWAGVNYGAYSNPRLDELLDRWHVTIDPRESASLQQQIVKEQIGDLGVLPLYWQVVPVLAREGISGLEKSGRNTPTRFVFEWDKK